MITDFWPALAGGSSIGLAAALLLATNGRIAGISGILDAALEPRPGALSCRVTGNFDPSLAFVMGDAQTVHAPFHRLIQPARSITLPGEPRIDARLVAGALLFRAFHSLTPRSETAAEPITGA